MIRYHISRRLQAQPLNVVNHYLDRIDVAVKHGDEAYGERDFLGLLRAAATAYLYTRHLLVA